MARDLPQRQQRTGLSTTIRPAARGCHHPVGVAAALPPATVPSDAATLRRGTGPSKRERAAGALPSGTAGPMSSSPHLTGWSDCERLLVDVTEHVGGGGVHVGDRLRRDDDPCGKISDDEPIGSPPWWSIQQARRVSRRREPRERSTKVGSVIPRASAPRPRRRPPGASSPAQSRGWTTPGAPRCS